MLLEASQQMVAKVDEFVDEQELDKSIEIEGSGDSGDKDEGPALQQLESHDKETGSALIEEVESNQKLQTSDQPADPNVLLQEKDKVLFTLDSLKIDESLNEVGGPSALQTSNPVEAQQDKDDTSDSMIARALQSEYNRADGGADA